MPPDARVCLYAPDSELRTWLADELALLPSIEVHALDTVQALEATPAELLIVSIDMLTLADTERVRELVARTAAPVIAIGTPTATLANVGVASVLDATLTSKQLKRAVRESLSQAFSVQPTAHPGA